MSNDQNPAPLASIDFDAMLNHLEKSNPQMFERLQAMTPGQLETAKEHLLAQAALSTGGHGHSHTHSNSCRHGIAPQRTNQPVLSQVEFLNPSEMNIVQAVQHNQIERVKELIESGQANVNASDDEKCYPLHWASINNHTELVRYLLAKGATVDIKGGDLHSTPLHWACKSHVYQSNDEISSRK
jgi:hypothetical protein